MTAWTRSSRCGSSACVEARRLNRAVLVRDSKLGDLRPQTWSRAEWTELLRCVRASGPIPDGGATEYLHPAIWQFPSLNLVHLGLDLDGESGRHEPLEFTYEEWNAFVAGVLAGEFDFDNLPTPSASAMAEGEGPPPVNPPPLGSSGERCDQDPSTTGESYLPAAATPLDSPAAADHHHVAGWGGETGRCGVECVCGVTFDGFDTIAEAVELLDHHIGSATAATVEYGDLVLRKVEPQYIVERAPERTLLALSMLQAADERALFVAGGDTVYIGYGPDASEVSYQVTGWDAERRALILDRVDARADVDALARAAAPLVRVDESSPAGGVAGEAAAAERAAVTAAAGGEVVPAEALAGVDVGTTAPEGEAER